MENHNALKPKMYHGTTFKLNVGQELLPPIETGSSFFSHPDIDPLEFDNINYVYLTSNLDFAKNFGLDKSKKGDTVYVYEVEPSKDLEKDPESDFNGFNELFRCSKATIKNVVLSFKI